MPRPTITVREAILAYLDLKDRKLAEKTVYQYRLVLKNLERSLGPDRQLASVTTDHMERFFYTGQKARVKELGARSFNKEYYLVRNWMQYCVRRGWIHNDILAEIEPVAVIPKKRLRLTAEELKMVLDLQDHPRDRALIALSINTAFRANELCRLRIGDLDLGTSRIWTVLTKNKKSDSFPVSAALDREMRRWLSEYTELAGHLKDCKHEECENSALCKQWYLIPAKHNDVLRDPVSGKMSMDPKARLKPTVRWSQYPHWPVQRALKQLGYPTAGEGLHTLRRSVALAYYTYMAEHEDKKSRDDALLATQALLNHSSARITQLYIGEDRARKLRDDSIIGQDFLGALTEPGKVVPLRGEARGS